MLLEQLFDRGIHATDSGTLPFAHCFMFYFRVPVTIDGETAYCAVLSNSTSEDSNTRLLQNYGLSATHPTLPVNTKVLVTIGNKKGILTINNHKHKVPEADLVLSADAAKVFNSKHDGIVECSMYIPVFENNLIIRTVRFLLPYIGILVLVNSILSG